MCSWRNACGLSSRPVMSLTWGDNLRVHRSGESAAIKSNVQKPELNHPFIQACTRAALRQIDCSDYTESKAQPINVDHLRSAEVGADIEKSTKILYSRRNNRLQALLTTQASIQSICKDLFQVRENGIRLPSRTKGWKWDVSSWDRAGSDISLI